MKLVDFRAPFVMKRRRPKVTFLDLPNDVIGNILSLLAVGDHIACILTCKHLAHIGSRQWVWRRKYEADFDGPPCSETWKQSYAWQYQYWAMKQPLTSVITDGSNESAPKVVYDADYDGTSLVVSTWSDSTVCVSNLRYPSHPGTVLNVSRPVFACAISPHERLIFLGTEDGKCLVLCTQSMLVLVSTLVLQHDEAVHRIADCPYGVFLAGSRGTISLYRAHGPMGDNRVVRLCNAHSAAINGLVYSEKHNLIVSMSSDGRVKVWRWSHAEDRLLCCRKYTLDFEGPSSLAVHEDSFIIGGSADGSIFEFNLFDGSKCGRFAAHQRQVRALHVEGRHMVSGSYDGTVRMWDLRTKQLLQTIGDNASKGQWVLSVRLKHKKVVYGAGTACNLAQFT